MPYPGHTHIIWRHLLRAIIGQKAEGQRLRAEALRKSLGIDGVSRCPRQRRLDRFASLESLPNQHGLEKLPELCEGPSSEGQM